MHKKALSQHAKPLLNINLCLPLLCVHHWQSGNMHCCNHQPYQAVVTLTAVCCCSGWNAFKDFGEISSINNLAGTISFIFGLLLWVTSVDWVRRRFYQTFHSVHMIGFLGFTLFALLHYSGMWVGCVPGNFPLSPFATLPIHQ